MTATTCAWCKALANMTPVSIPQPGRIDRSSNHKWVQGAFRCNNCSKLSIGSTVIANTVLTPTTNERTWWDDKEPLHWTPEQVGGRDFPDVPSHIASAGDEAFKCRSIKAFRAAILLARSAIEATCKDNGVTRGQLATKIDDMAAKGLIRPFTQDAAHELRHLGNDMAHGDFVDDVDADDADAVLEVMAEILNEVYQGPARVGRMRAKREGAANGTPSAGRPITAPASGSDFVGSRTN